MKKWMITAAIFCFLLFSTGISAGKGNSIDLSNFDGKAVSLKILQQTLKGNHGKKPLPANLSGLCGINRILGYVVDEKNRDIILIGEVDKKLPPLYLEDFVIALRNAWDKYARIIGNTIEYSYPGCTIDPIQKVLRQLEEIGAQIHARQQPGEIEKAINQWRKVCRSPQEVDVNGVPFHSRFGWVMVKADYDMKILVDGSDSLNIGGFSSLIDITLDIVKENILNGEPISLSLSALNRFWFYPGKNLYLEDEGVVIIDQCEVILLSEAEYLTEKGIAGSGRASPLAEEFSKDFSSHYSQIAAQRPIYYELENLFRFVALAKILEAKSPHKRIGFHFDYLLNQYPLSSKRVDQRKPGRSHVKKFEHKENVEGGYRIFKLWIPSCGGVIIKIDATPDKFRNARTNELKNLKAIVLNRRPSPEELTWNSQGPQESKKSHKQLKRPKPPLPPISRPGESQGDVIDPMEIQGLNKINQANVNFAVTFIVEKRDSNYKVYYNSSKPIYEGPNILLLLKEVMKRLVIESILCFDLKGFTVKESKSFEENLRNSKESLKLAPLIMPIQRKKNSTEARDILYSVETKPELQGKEPIVEKVTAGRFKGLFKAVFHFLVQKGDRVIELTIKVFSKVKEIPIMLFNKLQERRSSPGEPKPLIRDIMESIKDIKKTQGGKSEIIIIIEFLEQILGIDIVLLNSPNIENQVIKTAA